MDATNDQFARAFARELAQELRENPPVPNEYLTPIEAAQFVKLTPRGLELMRAEQRGPRYCRVGRLVRYRIADLRAWLDAGVVEP